VNQVVKRNIYIFPEDFYFQLTKEEYESILRSQNVTLELDMSLKSQNVTSSRNHAGSKTFSINILEDEIVKNTLLKSISVNCH